jgi:hypothetical protein
MHAHRISIDAHYTGLAGFFFESQNVRLTIDRDRCDTAWFRISGSRRIVMKTTTPAMLNRMTSWILLFTRQRHSCPVMRCTHALQSSLICRNIGNGNAMSAISVTMFSTAMVMRFASARWHDPCVGSGIQNLFPRQPASRDRGILPTRKKKLTVTAAGTRSASRQSPPRT